MDFIGSIIKSKWFWIILAVLIIAIIINKNWEAINDKLFQRKVTNYATDANGNVIPVTQLDQPRINAIMDNIKTQSGTVLGLFAEDLAPALALSDQELEYGAKYFKTAYSQSLYSVVDNSWMPTTQLDQQLTTRLDKLALK